MDSKIVVARTQKATKVAVKTTTQVTRASWTFIKAFSKAVKAGAQEGWSEAKKG